MKGTHSRAAFFCAAALLGASAPAFCDDVVTEWNDTYLDVIRLTGGPPCPISRAGAMMNLSIYDAINSIDRVTNINTSYEKYQSSLPDPTAGSSREAAAAEAAYTVMSNLYAGSPASLALIQARYNSQMSAIPNGPAKTNGQAFGLTVGNSMLTLRQADGSNVNNPYVPGGHAGDWRNTPDGPNLPAFNPDWGNVTPFGLAGGSQYRPTRLTDFGDMDTLMHSPEYAEQINGGPGVLSVKDYGSRTSGVRTAEQTEIAWFWANDRNGTSKPPGQLLQITKVVSDQQGLTLSQNARLFGLVGMAMGDAGIAAWDAKYATPIDLWRPIDAIRESQDDGNAATTPDPAWLPLNDFTPPFPAYVSGHATFGAVHAAIMRGFFGTDNITFTVGSDEFGVNPGLGYPANLTRTFNSFSEAAWENAVSRVYLGVHYYWDAVDANTLGTNVGDYVYSNYLRPVPEPAAAVLLALAALAIRRRR